MKKFILLIIAVSLIGLTACDEKEIVNDAPLRVYIDLPINISNPELSEMTARLVNVENLKTYETSDFKPDGDGYVTTIVLPEGRYNITVTGKMNYMVGESTTSAMVRSQASGVNVTAGNAATSMVRLFLNNYNAEEGLVIEEIFFTSSTYPTTQRPYNDDQYIKITNNSDHLIYADSLAIVESKFQPDTQWELTPNLIREAISISWMYLIPGTGTSVPVEPGESLLIAFNAKNHTAINSNSFDLSSADFEFYDESTNAEFVDEDNPGVPNLIKWYNDMWSYAMLHNKGNKSYGLGRGHSNFDTFISDNYYKFTYIVNAAWGTYQSNGDAYFIPNTWVIDMVNLSIKSDWAWNVVSPTLDSGWTYCAETASDKTRYGLSVVRKRDATGKLVDSNNSTADFMPRQQPSMAH